MNKSQNIFESELNKLLGEYLNQESFNKLNYNVIQDKDEEGISEKISSFYKEQLQINIDNSSDRINIDRIITFSEKKLEFNQFFELLLELGEICRSNGKLDIATEIYRKANKYNLSDNQKADVLFGFANVYSKRANWSKCITSLGEAALLYKSSGKISGVAKCENLLGVIFGELGDLENAKKHFLNSLSFIDSVKEPELTAKLETNLGLIENIQGNSTSALVHLQSAYNIYSSLDHKKGIAETRLNMGMIYFDSANYNSAIIEFDEGIKFAKQGNYLPILCITYLAKSQSLLVNGSIMEALEFADKAMEISHSIDDKLTIADIYKIKGIIDRKLKKYNSAEVFLKTSLRINITLKNEMNIAEASFELAQLYHEINNYELKNLHFKNSLKYYKEINSLTKVRQIEELLYNQLV